MSDPALTVGLVGPQPPPNGGMAMQTRQLAQLLKTENISVEQVATNPPYEPEWVEHFKGIRALFRLVPYVLRIWRLAGRVDVVHMMANSGWSWQLFCAPVVWIGWVRGTPVIVNYRGGEAAAYFEKSFSYIAPTLNKAYKTVVPSGFLREIFLEYDVPAEVIPNIINMERFRPAEEEKVSERFSIIVTRNLEPIYGIDVAIRAMKEVLIAVPNALLLIAGSGPQEGELRALTRDLGLEESVKFVGRLNGEEIVSFYQSANVMLNPTTIDNMPNSVLEALSCGVPVVSTNVGGVPFMVKHNYTALLVNAGASDQMAAAIVRIYNDEPLRNNLVTAGIEEVSQYTWPQVRLLWLNLYREAAGGGVL